ncbi:hypothetical protein ABPG72_013687 [Tetrahymena utriculariae]
MTNTSQSGLNNNLMSLQINEQKLLLKNQNSQQNPTSPNRKSPKNPKSIFDKNESIFSSKYRLAYLDLNISKRIHKQVFLKLLRKNYKNEVQLRIISSIVKKQNNSYLNLIN